MIGRVGRVLLNPFRTLAVHRQAVEIFVSRDLRGRYINSALGLWWAVIQPLALLTLYTFVFSVIMKVKIPSEGQGTGNFAVYLFCGLLPWLAFADAVTRSASVIIEQTPLIKKVAFPSEILPVHLVLSAIIVEFFGLAVFLTGLVVSGRRPGWSLLALPIVVMLQFLFTSGVAWLLASVTVFLRDARQVVGLALTLWMFLTPIMYPVSLMPERFRWVLSLNPMTFVVDAYRGAVLGARPPSLTSAAVFASVALVVFVSGHWVFSRAKPAFADML
jgi:homopolymeric O-antigen transport system permease protein